MAVTHSSPLNLLAWVGDFTLDRLADFGDFWSFNWHTLKHVPAGLTRRRDLSRLWPQVLQVGAASVPVILVTGLFVGMVIHRSMGVRDLFPMLREAGELSAVILVVVSLAGIFAFSLSTLGVIDPITRAIVLSDS